MNNFLQMGRILISKKIIGLETKIDFNINDISLFLLKLEK